MRDSYSIVEQQIREDVGEILAFLKRREKVARFQEKVPESEVIEGGNPNVLIPQEDVLTLWDDLWIEAVK